VLLLVWIGTLRNRGKLVAFVRATLSAGADYPQVLRRSTVESTDALGFPRLTCILPSHPSPIHVGITI
jgi:hypothetical protein